MVTPVLSLASFKPPAFPGAASYKGCTLRDQVTSGLKSDTIAPPTSSVLGKEGDARCSKCRNLHFGLSERPQK